MNALANSVHNHVSVFSLSMGAPLCQEEGLVGLISLFPEPCAGGGAMQGCWKYLSDSGASAFPTGLLAPTAPPRPTPPPLSPTSGFISNPFSDP